MFVSSTQFFIMAPVLPAVARQFCVAEDLLGILVGIYSLSLGVSALFAGFLSDKLGRRKILLLGSGSMALVLLFHVFAFNFYSLLILRFLAGVSGGLLTGSCVAYVRDYFAFESRGKANGWILTGSALGQILGIPAGILLAERFGTQSPFLLLGVCMLPTFWAILRNLPEPRQNLEVAEASKVPISNLFSEYLLLIQQRFYRRAALGYMLMFFSVTIYLVYFPQWMEQTKAATATDLALLFLIGGVASLIAGPLAGWLSDRGGRSPVVMTSSISMAGAMGMSLFFRLDVLAASVVFFAIMLFMSSRSVAYQSMISDKTCDQHRGKGLNLLIATGQIGMAGGSVLAGPIYAGLGFEVNTILAGLASVGLGILAVTKWPTPVHVEVDHAMAASTEKHESVVLETASS